MLIACVLHSSAVGPVAYIVARNLSGELVFELQLVPVDSSYTEQYQVRG